MTSNPSNIVKCPAISLSVSQFGDIYAGLSTGEVMRLLHGASEFTAYVSASNDASELHTMPRWDFSFASPICIDAWGSKWAQYVGDGHFNRIYEVTESAVNVIAGTGQKGNRDGKALTEASFNSIRSISVLPRYVAVLSSSSHDTEIRLIHRTTHQVTTLPLRKSTFDRFYLLNAVESPSLESIYVLEKTDLGVIATSIPLPDSSSPNKEPTSLRGLPWTVVLGNGIPGRSSAYSPALDTLFWFDEESLRAAKKWRGVKDPRFDKSIPSIAFDFPNTSNLLLLPEIFEPDLKILHKASNTWLHLHRSVIDREMLGRNAESSPSSQLATFLASSTLPIATIMAFLDYRYFKPLQVDSATLLHFASISKAVFKTDDAVILNALQSRVKADSAAEVCTLLIRAWLDDDLRAALGDLDAASPVTAILLARVCECQANFKSVLDGFAVSSDPVDLAKCFSRTSSLLLMVAAPPKAAPLPAIEKPRSDRFHPVELAFTTDFLALYSTNFVFEITSVGSIGVCGWLLYAHWPWFKRLVDSGLQESKTRVISLPTDSFTLNALGTVLLELQFNDMRSSRALDRDDTISILRHAEAFGLADRDGNALPQVKKLISSCEISIFRPPTNYNCWEQLRVAHAIGSSKYKPLLVFVATEVTQIPTKELARLSEQTVLDLFRELKANE